MRRREREQEESLVLYRVACQRMRTADTVTREMIVYYTSFWVFNLSSGFFRERANLVVHSSGIFCIHFIVRGKCACEASPGSETLGAPDTWETENLRTTFTS